MISGVGSLLSGLGTRPDLTPFYYMGKTPVYNLPYLEAGNILPDGTYKRSSKDEKTKATIIENTLVGLLRTHGRLSFMATDGIAEEAHNHAANMLIVKATYPLAIINNIVVGFDQIGTEISWSGLSQTGSNWLWLSLVEEGESNFGYKSSIAFRDVTAQFTVDNPNPPDNRSVLYATFTSGIGINLNPVNKTPFTIVSDHVFNGQDPHGLILNQQYLNTSGLEIINQFNWDSSVASGQPNILYKNSITYETTATLGVGCEIIASGISGNILSGSFPNGLMHQNEYTISNLAVIGNCSVTYSGLSVSGSSFHDDISLGSGITMDGVYPYILAKLISKTSLSGGSAYHTHALLDLAEGTSSLFPKYDGQAFQPTPYGDSLDRVIYNTDLENGPTLRREFNTGYRGATYVQSPNMKIFIRQYMPQGYDKLDKIEVHHKVMHNGLYYYYKHPKLTARIIDAAGNAWTPYQGANLHIVSGSEGSLYMTISGIDQTNLAPNYPFDLELTMTAPISYASGTTVLLGEIVTYYTSQSN